MQVRQQVRKVQPKAAAAPTAGQTKRQRERFVQAGGMLQGYAPEFVLRAGYISIGIAVGCVITSRSLGGLSRQPVARGPTARLKITSNDW